MLTACVAVAAAASVSGTAPSLSPAETVSVLFLVEQDGSLSGMTLQKWDYYIYHIIVGNLASIKFGI